MTGKRTILSGMGILMCLTVASFSCSRQKQTASKQEPEKEPKGSFTYNLRFRESPGPGDYEFGTWQGSLALFFRCGFTIEGNKQESKPNDMGQQAKDKKEAEAPALQPKAMTKEEIEKQLFSEPRVTGDITLNGNPLCSIDSDKAEPYPWRELNPGEPRPSTWAVITETPALVIKLSSDVPNRITLMRMNGEWQRKDPFILEKVP